MAKRLNTLVLDNTFITVLATVKKIEFMLQEGIETILFKKQQGSYLHIFNILLR